MARAPRIVEEDGGTCASTPTDRVAWRHVADRVENGTALLDPDGTRVRIDDRGIDIDAPFPRDIGVNEKGNPTSSGDATPTEPRAADPVKEQSDRAWSREAG